MFVSEMEDHNNIRMHLINITTGDVNHRNNIINRSNISSAFERAPRVPLITTIFCCLIMSVMYVSSLYIWRDKHNRDHPTTVKRRFLSVTMVMLFTPLFVYKFSSEELLQEVQLNELLGLRLPGLLMAITIPTLLTFLLFLGPICVQVYTSSLSAIFESESEWTTGCCFTDVIWIRNHMMAPLSEEFVFRACMMPLVMQSFSAIHSVFITPLFFGVAHIHHIIERLNMGMALNTALVVSLSQLTYTTLFGFYSAYLFARTGHLVAPYLVHAVCNQLGLPDIQKLWQLSLWKRLLFMGSYVGGLIGWILLLPVATRPQFYSNDIFWPLSQEKGIETI